MPNDPFKSAGEEFRREEIRNNPARDQGLQAVTELAEFCERGIASFYDRPNPDVYAELVGDSRLMIRFGCRPGKFHPALIGPWAIVLLTPDGRLLWSETDDWLQRGEEVADKQGATLDASDYSKSIAPKLIAFLTKAENQYLNAVA